MGKTNASGKVIPTLPKSRKEKVRVFFFDDNLSLVNGGTAHAAGICNLRDVFTGDYVDFSVGVNGFKCDHRGRHTFIHASTEYQSVLVQVNILDAMLSTSYFNDIVEEYSEPNEKLIIFMDVNGTVLWEDTVSGKGQGEVLLSTMFRLLEVDPKAPVTFTWQSNSPVEIGKQRALKDIVRDVFGKNEDAYKAFWNYDTCIAFFVELGKVLGIRWASSREAFTVESFKSSFDNYLEELNDVPPPDGIPKSWFRFYQTLLDGGHTTVLNSFGVDTQKIVLRSVPKEREVLHITVNYSQWGKRDLDAFNKQFARA